MEYEDKLLKEYELCHQTAQRCETSIWSTGTIFGVAAIGSFALVVGRDIDIRSLFFLGLISSAILFFWWRMSIRWWNVQHTTFDRMRHIEEQLGIFQVRYVYHRDAKITIRPEDLASEGQFAEKHAKELDHLTTSSPNEKEIRDARRTARKYLSAGVKKYIDILPFAFISAWLSFLLPLIWETYRCRLGYLGPWVGYIAFWGPLGSGVISLVIYLSKYYHDQEQGRKEIEKRYAELSKPRSP